MIYAASDLHGMSPEELAALLRRAGFGGEDFLFILGDVIDRNGDGGIALLQWIMLQPNVELLLGNHEDMLLRCAFLFDEITDASLDNLTDERLRALTTWLANGAEPTIASLKRLYARRREDVEDLLDFLRDAPLYETVSLDSGDFVLVHSGLGNFSPDRPLSAYSRRELLWHRPTVSERWFENVTTVFGHTPTAYFGETPDGVFRTDTWIAIDAGAAGGAKPVLLRLDDMTVFR